MKIYMALGKIRSLNIIGRYVKFCRLFLTPILKTHFPSMATLFLLHIFIFLLFSNISNIFLTIELVLYYIIHIIPSTHIFYKYYISFIYLNYLSFLNPLLYYPSIFFQLKQTYLSKYFKSISIVL